MEHFFIVQELLELCDRRTEGAAEESSKGHCDIMHDSDGRLHAYHRFLPHDSERSRSSCHACRRRCKSVNHIVNCAISSSMLLTSSCFDYRNSPTECTVSWRGSCRYSSPCPPSAASMESSSHHPGKRFIYKIYR